jgi:hypothetical protein
MHHVNGDYSKDACEGGGKGSREPGDNGVRGVGKREHKLQGPGKVNLGLKGYCISWCEIVGDFYQSSRDIQNREEERKSTNSESVFINSKRN